MAKGDTKTNQYLDIAANGTRADLPTDTCCETRSQTLIREVAERIMGVEDEVEELKNNPDVVDIVATYADLQAYDTQHLTDKDIIRVLQDETHDGESTYYRYNKQSDTWTYVGTVGDYYTKTAADAKFQDKLTAGSNITISDQNVISATDTTYSNFTGTDGTTAGTAGLVPAPATTDAGKFLSASGLWEAVAGGGGVTELTTADYNYPTNNPDGVALWLLEPGLYSAKNNTLIYETTSDSFSSGGTWIVANEDRDTYGVIAMCYGVDSLYYYRVSSYSGTRLSKVKLLDIEQSTGTSTTSVMSQNAVTSMVFADPSTKTHVYINGSGQTGFGKTVAIHGTASGAASVAIGSSSSALTDNAIAIGVGTTANGQGSIALGTGARAGIKGVFAIGDDSGNGRGYNSSNYRLLTGLYDGQSAHDAATVGQAVGTTETYTIATNDWTALSASSPYDYSATVTATYTIGNNTVAELLNDNPVAFAANGFAIGSISSQSVTIYSIGQPSASTTLKINYKG